MARDPERLPAFGQALRRLADEALRFLIDAQRSDGAWQDYDIRGDPHPAHPISDQWVSGYVGCALLDGAEAFAGSEWAGAASETAQRAADWLAGARSYEAGWGFNALSGPDADSTAWARMLQRRCGKPLEARDEAFLLAHLRADGGFATYLPGSGGWSETHPDVSVPSFLALSEATRQRLEARLWPALEAARRADGLWSSFWWRTPYYHSLNMLLLHRSRRRPAPAAEPLGPGAGHRVHGAADVALLAAIDALRHGIRPATVAMIGGIRHFRHPRGGWPANAQLVIRAMGQPPVAAPAHTPADVRRRMTAAHLLRAVAVLETLRSAHETESPKTSHERNPK